MVDSKSDFLMKTVIKFQKVSLEIEWFSGTIDIRQPQWNVRHPAIMRSQARQSCPSDSNSNFRVNNCLSKCEYIGEVGFSRSDSSLEGIKLLRNLNALNLFRCRHGAVETELRRCYMLRMVVHMRAPENVESCRSYRETGHLLNTVLIRVCTDQLDLKMYVQTGNIATRIPFTLFKCVHGTHSSLGAGGVFYSNSLIQISPKLIKHKFKYQRIDLTNMSQNNTKGCA